MSLVGLVQLTERLLNQTLENPQENQQAQTRGKIRRRAKHGDQWKRRCEL